MITAVMMTVGMMMTMMATMTRKTFQGPERPFILPIVPEVICYLHFRMDETDP
jgi:hypothetical protein